MGKFNHFRTQYSTIMSDSETANDKTFEKEPPAKVVKKAKTAKSVGSKTSSAITKEGPSHPKYSDMIIEAIKELKLRTGCCRTAILKQIKEVHDVGDEKRATMYLSLALKKGVEKGIFKKAREEGKNSNKFKLGENAEVKKTVKKVKSSTEVTKPKSKKGAAVVKKSASTKSKEKASAKRNSLGSPPSKSKVKKVATKKSAAPAAKSKTAAGKKAEKPAAAAKKSDKKPSKAAAAKPKAAGSAKKSTKKTTPGKKPKPKK